MVGDITMDLVGAGLHQGGASVYACWGSEPQANFLDISLPKTR